MRTLLQTIIVNVAWPISPLVQWASIQWQWWMTSAVVHPYRTWSQDMLRELRRQRTWDDRGFANPPGRGLSATGRLNTWTPVHGVSKEQTA